MNILLDLINNPVAAGHDVDHRYQLWIDICLALQERGHRIYGQKVNRLATVPDVFEVFDSRDESNIDLFICHSPYNNQKKKDFINKLRNRKKGFLKRKKCHALVYDHGWLYKSLVVDRNFLFGDSFYHNDLAQRIQHDFNFAAAETYRLELLEKKLSKRLQPEIDPIPSRPYIFVPGQVLYDVSVVFYSKTGMLELLEKVIEFGKEKGVDVVFKPHPGMTEDPNHGKKEIGAFCERALNEHKHFHVVNNSIYKLMENALFTACVNSGSIVDNFVSQTPVYCCGNSLFAKTDAVLYQPDVFKGLSLMINKEYNEDKRQDHQLKILWWLRKNLIQESYSMDHNLSLLEMHLGARL